MFTLKINVISDVMENEKNHNSISIDLQSPHLRNRFIFMLRALTNGLPQMLE